jgi:flagellar biogenesis protein FliO
MNTLWRLAWALPLLLAVGVAVALAMRPFVVPSQRRSGDRSRMTSHASLALSDQTRVHLIDVDGVSYLVVESTQNALLQGLRPQIVETARPQVRFAPAWVRRFYEQGRR